MADETNHRAFVNAWMRRAAKGLSTEQLLQLFEQAFRAMWQRAEVALGEVTLVAIADRVFYSASEQYPVLSSIKVELPGPGLEALRKHAGELRSGQLAEAMGFVLAEFLRVLGNLTAEILTPALHSELSRLASRGTASGESGLQGKRAPRRRNYGEEAE